MALKSKIHNDVKVNFYLNSEGEPFAVESSQLTVSGSPKSPDPISDRDFVELNYVSIYPPSPIPFSDNSM